MATMIVLYLTDNFQSVDYIASAMKHSVF